MKCDKKIGPIIIELNFYIERVFRNHLYQIETYLYLPPALAASKMASLKLKFGTWIKQNSEHLTMMEKLFLKTNMQAKFDPFPLLYVMVKMHKTPWSMRPIISCTGRLMHTIGVCTGSKFQQVVAYITAYLKNSKVLK